MDKLREQVNLLVELALAEYEEERVEIKKELARCVCTPSLLKIVKGTLFETPSTSLCESWASRVA